MAETVDESAFWLPSDFLTDDDLFFPAKHKPPTTVYLSQPQPNNGGFPLYHRSSSALNSPGESVVSSTETESSEDPDEFIAELTRHLAQTSLRERATKTHHPQERGVMATSPQSTLSGFPNWTNRRSSPAFDANRDEALELIYAAAKRVSKMRMNTQTQIMNQQNSLRGYLGTASQIPEVRTPPVCYNAPQNNQFQQMKSHVKPAWVTQQQTPNRGASIFPQSSFPPLRPQPCTGACGGGGGPAMRAMFLPGSTPTGVKRQSTGTGVFLPRRLGPNNAPTEPRKKPGCSTVLLPARVVQALNLNIEEMNGHHHSTTLNQTQPCFSTTNHDIMLARRNAVLAQQQRRGIREHEAPAPLLPQEWTY